MSENRDFKGVWISKEVWLDKRLNALEKVILAEIDSLDNGEDGCWAGNEYLAEFCQCSVWKVSTAISKLIEVGYIEVASFDGRKRKLKSRLVKIQNQTCENHKTDFGNSKANNIKNNTKNNTTDSIVRFKKPTAEEVRAYCEERHNSISPERFIDHYEANGWMIGRNKMKDWKAAVRTWERNEKKDKPQEERLDDLDDVLL